MFVPILLVLWITVVLGFMVSLIKAFRAREILLPRNINTDLDCPAVTIIVPVRNEEQNIERCLRSLLNQEYPANRYSVIVVDDGSDDGTPSIIANMARDYDNLHILEAGNLPSGWKGKNHACWQGAAKAGGDWLCFVDADTMANERMLVTVVNHALSKRADMLSLSPFQELVSPSERILMPAVYLAIASSMKFDEVNDPEKTEAIANGQFILFKKSVYEALDGHRAVREEIMEDMAFARLVKSSGYRLRWAFGDHLISTRMYRDIRSIWEGFSKNLVDIMRNESVMSALLVALKSLMMGWLSPIMPLAAWIYLGTSDKALGWSLFIIAIAGTGSFVITLVLCLRTLRIPLFYVFFMPLGFTMHASLIVNSLWGQKRGVRKWKGRTYR